MRRHIGSCLQLLAVAVAVLLSLGACESRVGPLDELQPDARDAGPDRTVDAGSSETGEPDGGVSTADAGEVDGGDDSVPDAGVPPVTDDGGVPADGGPPVDADGVQMLFPSAPGASWRLGSQNPNTAAGMKIEKNGPATAHSENGRTYWNIVSFPLSYAGGGTGYTSRVHIYASGGTQQYTWKNTPGYLSNPKDVRNQEFTVYLRANGFTDLTRTQVSLKIRGGAHTSSNGDLSSGTLMTFGPAAAGTKRIVRFGKELVHPSYDYVSLTPKTAGSLPDGGWVGLKIVSFEQAGEPTMVVNRLYVDLDPWTSNGKPANGWVLMGEYLDVEGKSTGKYTRVVDWGGWQTTLRVDGITDVDFALLSVREIAAP